MGVDADTLLRLTDLTVDFESQEGMVHAVDKVSFAVAPRDLVSLVGESGFGIASPRTPSSASRAR